MIANSHDGNVVPSVLTTLHNTISFDRCGQSRRASAQRFGRVRVCVCACAVQTLGWMRGRWRLQEPAVHCACREPASLLGKWVGGGQGKIGGGVRGLSPAPGRGGGARGPPPPLHLWTDRLGVHLRGIHVWHAGARPWHPVKARRSQCIHRKASHACTLECPVRDRLAALPQHPTPKAANTYFL